jgi:hypothetical protein
MVVLAPETRILFSRLPDPVWPELTFNAIYRIAFKDRIIRTLDHPVVKRLRGE